MRTKVIKEIIKQVGINGLIAIKNDLKRCDNTNIYKTRISDSLGYTTQNLIFHHMVMVKDFAQYSN